MSFDRVFLIVCDSMGFGAADDAADYGDAGTDTIGHVSQFCGGLSIPNMGRIGAGHIHDILGVKRGGPQGIVGILEEASRGKDTLTGHWEMMGIVTRHPFITFPDGFPSDLVLELEKRTGRHIIGNKAASGTAILDELAECEIKDPKNMIVYTSADSVLQICGSEEVGGGLEELYRCCEIARELTLSRPEWRVARVIARPYTGKMKGEFARTSNRRDYSVAPPKRTVLDYMENAGFDVISIGKIDDIFSSHGITRSIHSKSSVHGMEQVLDVAKEQWRGLCFCNLSDFDVLWGHRRNPQGYASEIEKFDVGLGRLMDVMESHDLVIVTADHGNDPTAPGTDHTRENVPFLAWSPSISHGDDIGRIKGFYNIGSTIISNFGLDMPECYSGFDLLAGRV